jgi:hypothetical protein
VIVLTAHDTVQDRVAGLEAGADDYVVKPFSLSEVLVQVRARLRLRDQPSSVLLSVGDLHLDVRTRLARVPGGQVALSAREFALLEVLLRHSGQVLSQPQLLDQVWGMTSMGPPTSWRPTCATCGASSAHTGSRPCAGRATGWWHREARAPRAGRRHRRRRHVPDACGLSHC